MGSDTGSWLKPVLSIAGGVVGAYFGMPMVGAAAGGMASDMITGETDGKKKSSSGGGGGNMMGMLGGLGGGAMMGGMMGGTGGGSSLYGIDSGQDIDLNVGQPDYYPGDPTSTGYGDIQVTNDPSGMGGGATSNWLSMLLGGGGRGLAGLAQSGALARPGENLVPPMLPTMPPGLVGNRSNMIPPAPTAGTLLSQYLAQRRREGEESMTGPRMLNR